MTKEDISKEHFTIVRHFRRSRSEQEYLSAAYEIIPDLVVNFGIARVFYVDKTTSMGIELNKRIYLCAMGFQYKFFTASGNRLSK